MGKSKKFMDDGDSSDEESGRIQFDVTDRDLDDELAGFSGFQRGGKKEEDSSDEEMTPQAFTPATKEPKKTPVKRAPTSIRPDSNFGQFSAHSNKFGQKLLEKMGWKVGQGLGSEGEGIVNPIETKLRPSKMGLGFRGFDERTDQAKKESKEESEEEEEKPKRREAWKNASAKPKMRKTKTVYKTSREIVADIQPITQKILDMTGPGVREVNVSDIRDSPTMIETTSRLPELRHNLRLIVDMARTDLENVSREKQKMDFEMKSLKTEIELIGNTLEQERKQRAKVERIHQIAADLERMKADALATGAYEEGNVTALFGEKFDILEKEFLLDLEPMNLDALVVSVWAPVFKYRTIYWDILKEPTWGLLDIKRWKKLLPTSEWKRDKERQVSSPYETMINTIWLSKVQSAINNQWDYHYPETLIVLLEEWMPVLPRFIFENVLDQLVLPKIKRAVEDWNPKTDEIMIHTWIHPWIPLLQKWRLSEIFVTIRQKMSIVLRQWHPSDESALHIILPWKSIWTGAQTEQFVLQSILPKLANTLRDECLVNPRDQQLDSLVWCLSWNRVLSHTVMGQLLENEFFGKWNTVLNQWLLLDITLVNFDEIADWYLWWRNVFDTYGLQTNKLVMDQFKHGLDLMNRALHDKKI